MERYLRIDKTFIYKNKGAYIANQKKILEKRIWQKDIRREKKSETHPARYNVYNKTIVKSVELPWWRSGGFPGGAVVKNPPANAGDTGSSPGPGRSHMPRSN